MIKLVSPEGVVSPGGIARMIQYKEEGRPTPKVITDLTARIEAMISAAEVVESATGIIDPSVVKAIMELKLRKDALYAQWFEGTLEQTAPNIVIAH